jgi:outer membrane biosynthesis protein TonB
MDMQVAMVEVVARIASSVVDIAHVPPSGRYRIGTAPEVELAVAVGTLRNFPLLDEGFRFRRPAGVAATLHTGTDVLPITDSELTLRPGWRVELELGKVTVSLAMIRRTPMPVPRRPVDVRPFVYAAVVLVAHLLVWGAAMLLEPIERLGVEVVEAPQPPRIRVTHVEELPPPPKPKKSAQKQAAVAASAPPAQREEGPRDPQARAIAGARKTGILQSKGLWDVSALIPKVDVKKLVEEAVAYDEEEATKNDFGKGGRRFDPMKNCTKDCGLIAAGKYATVSKGRGAGDSYDLPGAAHHAQPEIGGCEPTDCTIAGGTLRETVRHNVELRMGAFGYCYQRFAAKQLRGTLTLSFVIGPEGAVHEAKARGMTEIDDCVVEVLKVIPFEPAVDSTKVTYPLQFRPNAEVTAAQ